MKLLTDVRYGVRTLLRSPGVSAAAVLSLALGIGANTTIYSWVKAVLLRPLPGVARQQDIVEIVTRTRARTPNSVSYPDYVDIRDAGPFDGVFAQSIASLNLSTDDTRVDAQRLFGALVSGNYFDVLGVRAVVGRTFLPEEDRTPGSHPVVVINDRTWQRYFHGDPGVVGSTIKLNGHPFTVVGVTPEAFQGTVVMLDTAAWVPMMMQEQMLPGGNRLNERGSRWLQVMARTKPDIPLVKANAGLGALALQLARAYPGTSSDRTFEAMPLYASPFGPQPILRPVLIVLSGVVGVVLLIACANVANLLLARAVGRRREIAIRLAVGAGRARLVRQLLTESVLLAALGGAAGLLFALWGRGMLMNFAPPTDFPVRVAASVDVNLLLYTAAVSIATGLLFGLAPALQASNPALANVLKDETSGAGGGRARARLRGLLVAGQVALSLLLLVGASLFLQGLQRAQVVNPGFDPSHAIRASFDLFPNGYSTEEGLAFQRRLVERLEATPGVESAAVARRVPLDIGGISSITVRVDGYDPAPDEEMQVAYNAVGSHYFQTMRIPIVAGRPIDETDLPDTTPVVVVNETMAARYWKGQDAIGKLVRIADMARQVVGVAARGQYVSLGEDPVPYMYFPLAQAYRAYIVVHMRTAGDPASFVPTLREIVKSLDPNLPLHDVMTMETHMGFATIGPRMAASLLGLFGALALGLATIGLYGVIAYAVSQRTREVGIRMALGAQPGDILRAVLGQGLALTLVGVGVGLVAALAVMPLMASQLYDVNPTDPATLGGEALLLTLVALLASYLPARLAARIDPVVALRRE